MADSTKLIFSQPPASGLPVRLIFGDDDDGSAPEIPDVTVNGAIHTTGLRFSAALHYDVNVSRPTVGHVRNSWQEASGLLSGVVSRYHQAQPITSGAQARWQDARAIAAPVRSHWQQCERVASELLSRYQQARSLPVLPLLQRYQDAERLRAGAWSRFQEAVRLPAPTLRQCYQETIRLRSGASQRYQEAVHISAGLRSGMGIALQVFTSWRGRYQEAWPPRPGRWAGLRPPDPQPDPCYLPELPVRLVFEEEGTGGVLPRLVFICERHSGPGPEPGATVVVPVRRIYMTINNVTLHRVDGNVLIPAYSFGMSLDVDSWTWGWQATLHADALPIIQPDAGGDPVDILATINGVPYRLLAESYSRQRQFGNTRISVKGRGRAAMLDAPYAPVLNHGNSSARTAQQLMADVLTVNGVGIGWDVDWTLTDWLVPGNVWAHQGSYISALQDIAQAVGGYLQPHDTAQTVRVLHRYPSAPWDWGGLTPAYELPSSSVAVEGIDWRRMATYDRVIVEGVKVGAGVRGDINRAGSAGLQLAPMVVHPLITHADAARQRGVAELSNSGSQAHISLRLPVLAGTGVIKPGALVRYVDGADIHLGLVRSTSLEWAQPKLRQVLTVETHLSE